MGVIEELRKADEVKFADNGGFISPSGLEYIGAPRCSATAGSRQAGGWRRARPAAAAEAAAAVCGGNATGSTAAAAEHRWRTGCPPTTSRVPRATHPTPRPGPAGNSQHKLGTAAACAVRRIDLDVRVARAARRAGAELMEGFEVGRDVAFSPEEGLWTVKSIDVRAGRCSESPLPLSLVLFSKDAVAAAAGLLRHGAGAAL